VTRKQQKLTMKTEQIEEPEIMSFITDPSWKKYMKKPCRRFFYNYYRKRNFLPSNENLSL